VINIAKLWTKFFGEDIDAELATQKSDVGASMLALQLKHVETYAIIPFVPPTAQGLPPDLADAETLPVSASIVRAV
jgi:hypothetical protein